MSAAQIEIHSKPFWRLLLEVGLVTLLFLAFLSLAEEISWSKAQVLSYAILLTPLSFVVLCISKKYRVLRVFEDHLEIQRFIEFSDTPRAGLPAHLALDQIHAVYRYRTTRQRAEVYALKLKNGKIHTLHSSLGLRTFRKADLEDWAISMRHQGISVFEEAPSFWRKHG